MKYTYDTKGNYQRAANITRNTAETQISVYLNIDGTGVGEIDTGVPFLDHMLEQITRHGLFDLTVKCQTIIVLKIQGLRLVKR